MPSNAPINPTNLGQSAPDPLIRTMQKDIEKLSQSVYSPQKKTSFSPPIAPLTLKPPVPPPDLPISDMPISEIPKEIQMDMDIEDEIPTVIPDIPKSPAITPLTKDTDIKKMVQERIKEEDELTQKVEDREKISVDQQIKQQLNQNLLPIAEKTEEEKKREEAFKKAQTEAKFKQDELERKRRAEEEEQVPKEFAEEMTKETLEQGRQKVATLAVEEKKGNVLKYIIIILAIVVVLGGIGGGIYWWSYLRPIAPPIVQTHLTCQNNQCLKVDGQGQDQCLTDEQCAPVITVPEPTSLIPTSQSQTIELTGITENVVFDKLLETSNQDQPINTLRKVLIKYSTEEARYLTLTEFSQAFGVSLLPAGSENDYTLYFFSQPEGNRLGIVINISAFGLSQEQILSLLKSKEATLASDLKPIFLGNELGQPAKSSFSDNNYKNIAIRYLNFSDSTLTIDYALIGSKLIITTSKASMYAAIDALEEPAPKTND